MSNTGNGELILIVDDERDIVNFLATFLEDSGYRVVSARNGQEALEKVRGEKPDLITLDISMPKKSGMNFYCELREDPALKSIPVLVISAVAGLMGQEDGFSRFLPKGANLSLPDGILEKPLDREKLLGQLRELLKR